MVALCSFSNDLCRMRCFGDCGTSILLTRLSPAPIFKSHCVMCRAKSDTSNETQQRYLSLGLIAILVLSLESGSC